jgi:hypothetical protein
MLEKKIERREDGLIKNTTFYTQSPKVGKSVYKLEELEDTTISSTSNKIFDADEISQGRMLRAIKMLELKGETTIMWKLADNTIQEVTLDELKEAFVLAFNNQYQLWLNQ